MTAIQHAPTGKQHTRLGPLDFIYHTYAGSSEANMIIFDGGLHNADNIANYMGIANAILFLIADKIALSLGAGPQATEQLRRFEKGFRDIQRIRIGVNTAFLQHHALHVATSTGMAIGFGAAYTGLMMFEHYLNTKDDARHHALISISQCKDQQLRAEQLKHIQQHRPTTGQYLGRKLLAATTGTINGLYLSFSAYQVISLVASLGHFALSPHVLIAAFCVGVFVSICFGFISYISQRRKQQREQQLIDCINASNQDTPSLINTHFAASQFIGGLNVFISSSKNNTLGLMAIVSSASALAKLITGTGFIATATGPVGLAILTTLVSLIVIFQCVQFARQCRKKTVPTQQSIFKTTKKEESAETTSQQTADQSKPDPMTQALQSTS